MWAVRSFLKRLSNWQTYHASFFSFLPVSSMNKSIKTPQCPAVTLIHLLESDKVRPSLKSSCSIAIALCISLSVENFPDLQVGILIDMHRLFIVLMSVHYQTMVTFHLDMLFVRQINNSILDEPFSLFYI